MEDQKRRLKIGDVVRLKSGGPWMVVTNPEPEITDLNDDGIPAVDCRWFEEFPEASEERWVLRSEEDIEADALELKDDK